MFTGIIGAVGTILAVEERGEDRSFRVRAPVSFLEGADVGDSVAVDGACFTVVSLTPETFEVDVIGSTLERTIAATYDTGARVNLERSLEVGDRVDGHFVQGHVDGLGELVSATHRARTHVLELRLPEEVHRTTVPRGSIAINGVSLTVADLLDHGRCRVGIIPHTWQNTNLRLLSPGDPVNVEGDLIGKHVGRMLAAYESES